MSTEQNGFVRVAATDEVVDGKPKAVKVEGRSIALFKHNGSVYATDNQCPHMGYPLTRGRVRNGVLTCDWHGWSYDLGGGGCFTGGCDDLETFPVEVRNGDVFVNVSEGGSKRSDAHFLLLKEGLYSTDQWTISKAVAIMLARGVSETDTLNLIIRHGGRHVATERGANDGGGEVSDFINGIKVARQYESDDRIIPLTFAAHGLSGRAGDRPSIQRLPDPITWEKIEGWIRVFSKDKQWEGIEKCLITARRLGGHDGEILPLLYECAVAPHFLGNSNNLLNIGYIAEVLEEFGWDEAEELVCNLSAKILGQERGLPDEIRQSAIDRFIADTETLDSIGDRSSDGSDAAFDEDAFAEGLVSGEIGPTFGVVTQALKDGVSIECIVTTMVVLAADRMARTPVNMNPGWGGLVREMMMASAIRKALRYGGHRVAAQGLYHVAWQFYGDRWLNITHRPLSEARGDLQPGSADEAEAIEGVLSSIEQIQIREIGRQTRDYLRSGYSGDALLRELGLVILKDDNGRNILSTLRTIFDEWTWCEDHPSRNQLLVGLARWATDVRRATGSQSAAATALRFAKGQTAVDLYEA